MFAGAVAGFKYRRREESIFVDAVVARQSRLASARVVSQIKVVCPLSDDAGFDSFVGGCGLALLIAEMAIDNAYKGSDVVNGRGSAGPSLVSYSVVLFLVGDGSRFLM